MDTTRIPVRRTTPARRAKVARASSVKASGSVAWSKSQPEFMQLPALFFELLYSLLPLAPIRRPLLGALMAAVGLFILMFTSFLLAPAQVLLPGGTRKSSPNRKPRRTGYRFTVVYYIVAVLVSPACMLVGGISLESHVGGGLYWALFGLVFTLYWQIMLVWQVIVGARPLESVIPTLDEPEQSPSGPSGAGPVSG
jgi:hypothetical protein